jgi:hypothetical protein
MARRRLLPLVLLLMWTAGCQQPGPLADTPPLFGPTVEEQNPVYIPLGPGSYGQVFENVLSTLGDYGFEIMESNRYDGRIETIPRIAPGLLQFFKPGSPNCYDRVLSTTQTYRHRVSITIQPADNGGYFVEVIARKELEDLERPIRSTAGAAIFRTENNVDRQFEVIDPNIFQMNWVYHGRDAALEQEIICRLKRRM